MLHIVVVETVSSGYIYLEIREQDNTKSLSYSPMIFYKTC